MSKIYDLEERTFEFASNCRTLVKGLKSSISNVEDSRQLVRSSGSIGANYIEANEKLGERDFSYRLKIARKEAKETRYWLRLLKKNNSDITEIDGLIQESEELRRILSAIINKT